MSRTFCLVSTIHFCKENEFIQKSANSEVKKRSQIYLIIQVARKFCVTSCEILSYFIFVNCLPNIICHNFLLTVESTRHIDTPWLPLTNSAAAVAVEIEDTLVGVALSDRRQLFVPLLRRGNGAMPW